MSADETRSMDASEQTGLLSDEKDPKPKPGSSFGWVVARWLSLILAALTIAYIAKRRQGPPPFVPLPNISVAFVGNSMTYYNDLPRFLTAISEGRIEQNSCLHGDGTLTSILKNGNGMYQKFNTSNALNSDGVYDFGACTVRQLMFGRDEQLEEQVFNGSVIYYEDLNQTNPCIQDPSYLEYLDLTTFHNPPPHYDYIVLNDYTQNPAREMTRAESLRVLREVYVPMFLDTGVTPIFFDTHPYWTEAHNMSGLVDVPTFASLTYQGYKDYMALVTKHLPVSQTPRLAPVGLAFLTVWEERRDLWQKLYNIFDQLHASPSGTFLTGAVIHFALFGEMPKKSVMLPANQDLSALWAHARVMQQVGEPPNPFPTFTDAEYLYNVADRVARQGYIPKSLIIYKHDEAAPDLER